MTHTGTSPRSSRLRRRLTTIIAALSLSAGLGVALATPANAESTDLNPDEWQWCVMNLSCATVKDASDWAQATAEWRYPDSLHYGAGDAYRHCIWSGALKPGLRRGGLRPSWGG